MRNKNFSASRDGQAIVVAGPTLLTDGQTAEDVLVDNRGTVDVYVLFGGAGAAATINSARVPAGAIMAFAKQNATHVSVYVVSGAPSIVLHFGEGC